MIGISLLKYLDGSAVTRNIDPAKTGIKSHHVSAIRDGQGGDHTMLVEIKDSHLITVFADQKRAAVLDIQRHAVVSLARINAVAGLHGVSCRINHGKRVLVLEIEINQFGHRIIL